jgi:hypothetical protein
MATERGARKSCPLRGKSRIAVASSRAGASRGRAQLIVPMMLFEQGRSI